MPVPTPAPPSPSRAPRHPLLLGGDPETQGLRLPICPLGGETSRTAVMVCGSLPGLRSGPSGSWSGELTINLDEAPVPGQLGDPGTQLKVEGGPVGGQVLIRGPQEKARALLWLAAHATRWWGQLRGVVIDLQDLDGQGPSGRAGWGGCRRGRPGRLLALSEPTAHPPSLLHGGPALSPGAGAGMPSLGQRAQEPRHRRGPHHRPEPG